MRFLHTMLRVRDLAAALDFFVTTLGLVEVRRRESEAGRFTLVFLSTDVYATCQRLFDAGVTIHRPPRGGRMAFVRSPDLHSVELLQRGQALAPREPWASMPNTGEW